MSEKLPHLTPEGLLPPGVHRATLDEVGRAFVTPECGDAELRSAVFRGVSLLATMARRMLGSGLLLIGGGFVSAGEYEDSAMVVYRPDDDPLARTLMASGAAVDLISLKGVIYSYPGGGGLRERWPVSGLVDAHLTDHATEIGYRKALAVVTGADGFGTSTVKGYVEVEVRSS